jgi:ABC-type nickel/cobalt efflux system permease component RcnA
MPAGLTRALGLAGLALVLALALGWATGAFDRLAALGLTWQQDFRSALAGAMRALRAGQDGAVWGLVALAFGYGVLHAAGPGHGKVLIGGYGVARRVALWRLGALAVVSSLAQATVAVALVYGGLGLAGLTRDAVGAAGDGWMVAAGHVAVAGIGLWLVWRGGRGLMATARAGQGAASAGHATAPHGHDHHHHGHHSHDHGDGHHHHHDHTGDHPHDSACEACGHRHGPTLAEAEAATSLREWVALVAGIAIRPCTGALMLLVLTWQLGLVWTGVLGAYAMGAGTALVTVAVAALAVTAREGALAGLPGLARARAALPLLELAAGAALAAIALSMLAAGR